MSAALNDPVVPFSPGLFVYFGYGIWHSKEGKRELQPKDMAARYVVLPSGSLVETVQSVQPDGQVDTSGHLVSSAPAAEECAEKRWCVTNDSRNWNCLIFLSLILYFHSLKLTPFSIQQSVLLLVRKSASPDALCLIVKHIYIRSHIYIRELSYCPVEFKHQSCVLSFTISFFCATLPVFGYMWCFIC